MHSDKTIEIIRSGFNGLHSTVAIPLMKQGRHFNATLRESGIEVDNLSTQKLLKWEIFKETVKFLESNNATAPKGNAMNGRLGDDKLPDKSVEGYLARKLFGKKTGDSVFRRISPVAAILSWASICENKRGELALKR